MRWALVERVRSPGAAQGITLALPSVPAEALQASLSGDRASVSGAGIEATLGGADGGALRLHCQRLGVRYDAEDVEGTVRRIIAHYGAP